MLRFLFTHLPVGPKYKKNKGATTPPTFTFASYTLINHCPRKKWVRNVRMWGKQKD